MIISKLYDYIFGIYFTKSAQLVRQAFPPSAAIQEFKIPRERLLTEPVTEKSRPFEYSIRYGRATSYGELADTDKPLGLFSIIPTHKNIFKIDESGQATKWIKSDENVL